MYLIDGHNLIAKIYGMSLAMEDKEIQLINILQDFARIKRKKVEVYFDKAAITHAGSQKHGRITAHYVHESSTADDAIIRRVQTMGNRSDPVVVITSDVRIQNAVRRRFVTVIPSEQFNRELLLINNTNHTPGKPDPDRQSPTELAEMEAMFRRRKNEAGKNHKN